MGCSKACAWFEAPFDCAPCGACCREAFDAVPVEPDDPTERLRIFLRGAFADEFLTADYLTLRITLWAISRTDPEMAEVERGLYIRYSRHLEQRIREAFPTLTELAARRRATDVIVVQNGLWLNWARYRDEDDLARGLRLTESIALAPVTDSERG